MAWHMPVGMVGVPANYRHYSSRFWNPPPVVNRATNMTYYHNPMDVAWRAFKGANLATTVAQGNYMTRNYRQKPINTLYKASHTRKYVPKPKFKPVKPKKYVKKSRPTYRKRFKKIPDDPYRKKRKRKYWY